MFAASVLARAQWAGQLAASTFGASMALKNANTRRSTIVKLDEIKQRVGLKSDKETRAARATSREDASVSFASIPEG